jgi:hypothetical protein
LATKVIHYSCRVNFNDTKKRRELQKKSLTNLQARMQREKKQKRGKEKNSKTEVKKSE